MLKKLLGLGMIGFGVILFAGIWDMSIFFAGPAAIVAIIAIAGGVHTL